MNVLKDVGAKEWVGLARYLKNVLLKVVGRKGNENWNGHPSVTRHHRVSSLDFLGGKHAKSPIHAPNAAPST